MSLPLGGLVAVVAGFRTVCWLGESDRSVPDLGRLAYRGVTRVDRRGRVVLDRRVRAWLGVPTPEVFEALTCRLRRAACGWCQWMTSLAGSRR
jgi:hypothetical protein